MTGFNQFLIEEPSIKKKKMKKVAIFLGAIAVFGLSSCNKCAECHAATDINGTEYELEDLGEYCGDELTSIVAILLFILWTLSSRFILAFSVVVLTSF